MAKYWVHSYETVYYMTEVEADSEQEAMQKLRDGEIDTGEPIDGEDFHVDYAELADE